MKKILKSPGLVRQEVPEGLSRRILLAGALAAAAHRRRRWRRWGAVAGMAAAVMISVAALLPGAMGGKTAPGMSGNELLALSDWTALEQESYNLSSQLNCGWQELPEVRML